MDTQERFISQATYSVGILATAQLNSFELVELTHVSDDAARMEDSRRRGMCQCIGVVGIIGKEAALCLDVQLSESAEMSIKYAFLERTRDRIAAWRATHTDSTDWLKNLWELPDTRV
ncbi:MAG TPA: hypothetical protein VNO32_09255 [Candidatus Acidoferrum sp.]|nr:hypothetical protein [Candidatus Acidoferrum sp.]